MGRSIWDPQPRPGSLQVNELNPKDKSPRPLPVGIRMFNKPTVVRKGSATVGSLTETLYFMSDGTVRWKLDD